MPKDSLQKSIDELSENWTGLNSQNIARTHSLLQNLASASPEEPWLASLHEQRLPTVELFRDDNHGFVMLGHTEPGANRFPPTTIVMAGFSTLRYSDKSACKRTLRFQPPKAQPSSLAVESSSSTPAKPECSLPAISIAPNASRTTWFKSV